MFFKSWFWLLFGGIWTFVGGVFVFTAFLATEEESADVDTIFSLVGLPFFLSGLYVLYRHFGARTMHRRIMAEGHPEKATIVSVTDSHVQINNVRQKNLRVRLYGQEIDIKILPPEKVAGLVGGRTVRVQFHPSYPSDLVLLDEDTGSAAGSGVR